MGLWLDEEQLGCLRVGGCLAGSILGPFGLCSSYLYFSVHQSPIILFSPDYYYCVLAFAVLLGVGCLALLPGSVWWRLLLYVVYMPSMICALYLYPFFFVCFAFGDCL